MDDTLHGITIALLHHLHADVSSAYMLRRMLFPQEAGLSDDLEKTACMQLQV